MTPRTIVTAIGLALVSQVSASQDPKRIGIHTGRELLNDLFREFKRAENSAVTGSDNWDIVTGYVDELQFVEAMQYLGYFKDGTLHASEEEGNFYALYGRYESDDAFHYDYIFGKLDEYITDEKGSDCTANELYEYLFSQELRDNVDAESVGAIGELIRKLDFEEPQDDLQSHSQRLVYGGHEGDLECCTREINVVEQRAFYLFREWRMMFYNNLEQSIRDHYTLADGVTLPKPYSALAESYSDDAERWEDAEYLDGDKALLDEFRDEKRRVFEQLRDEYLTYQTFKNDKIYAKYGIDPPPEAEKIIRLYLENEDVITAELGQIPPNYPERIR